MQKLVKDEVINKFKFEGVFIEAKPHGDGIINDSYVCYFKQPNKTVKRYLLQRINHIVFTDPDKLMKNFRAVTSYLKDRIIERGGDIHRETLTIIPSTIDEDYVIDSKGNYWRAVDFIEGIITYTVVNGIDDFYKTGKAFGNFQCELKDFPADTLYETIPNFHNTEERYRAFELAVENNAADRVQFIEKEILFARKNRRLASSLLDKLRKKELPLKVTHNDTKLNNILIDVQTKEGICIIDLDTIMPGLIAYDFGDSIRAGATWSAEDETDLDRVYLDLDLYDAFTRGFIEGSHNGLTKNELYSLPLGALVITYELGLRFLTDFINGDVYFKSAYYLHNLDRTRTQFKLLQDMQLKYDDMIKILEKYL